MSSDADPDHENAAANRSRFGIRVLAGIAVIVSIPHLFVVLSILPRFAAIYRDMYRDMPLPMITTLILQSRWGLVALACLWPFAAVLVARRFPSYKLLGALLVLMVAQMLFTNLALFLPLQVTIQAQEAAH